MADDTLSAFGPNTGYLAELYELYRSDPSLVDPAWAEFFRSGDFQAPRLNGAAATNGSAVVHAAPAGQPATGASLADRAIGAFRRWGHLNAKLSPFVAGGLAPQPITEILPATYLENRQASELDVRGFTFAGQSCDSMAQLLDLLGRVYCGSVGFEYEHIVSPTEREWLRERIEKRLSPEMRVSADARKEIFTQLLHADLLEAELHKKYVGAKWFSVEGNETLVPMLCELVRACVRTGVKEAVFGMAHRGRMNFLVNTLHKPLEDVFAEFEDRTAASIRGAGDVKYHIGYEKDLVFDGGSLATTLASNPSHLEFVNPVVEGLVRAKQDRRYGRNRREVLPVLMHGDAAFAGQGVVFESINYSDIEGYTTGGTLHIVINNQIGFTTTPDEGRSTRYCTDLAKGAGVPVFHVNSEDPEAACWLIRLALDYRNTFGKSAFIDLIGYRKYGHNEADDPSYTQPLTYAELKSKQPLWHQYGARLKAEGVLDDDFISKSESAYRTAFAEAQGRTKAPVLDEGSTKGKTVSPAPVVTSITESDAQAIARQLVDFPKDFSAHPKLAKILQKRVEAVEAGQGIEWGVAEALAFGALLQAGVPIRLSGQDCRRGTFSHRHLVLDDYEKPRVWSPLADLAERAGKGATLEIYNSSLSEAAIMGFEFGYAAEQRDGLTLWEAQFGDFANGGQVIIDQFLSSSESKWGQTSGLTLLLPHGFEGMGPEHSSARLERFLQLCADGNMSVCYPSTAAQYFHLIRRQGLRKPQRPLVVMTPKSLLRLPSAMSPLKDFTDGAFEPFLADPPMAGTKGACHTVVCMTGRVYHDVKAALGDTTSGSFRLARVEEIYPFPAERVAAFMRETKASKIIWVQEEPRNQGAFGYIAPLFKETTGLDLVYTGRPSAAATATGSAKHHALEQRSFLDHLARELAVSR